MSGKYFETDSYKNRVTSPCPPGTPTSHNSNSEDKRFSIFGDTDCGECQIPQHIVLDFTPDPVYDNPEVTQKCIDFWDLINKQTNIQHLCVIPDNNSASNFDSETTYETEVKLRQKEESIEEPPIKALELLEVSNETGDCCVGVCQYCSHYHPPPAPGHTEVDVLKRMCAELELWDEQHPKPMDPPGPVMQQLPILRREEPSDSASPREGCKCPKHVRRHH